MSVFAIPVLLLLIAIILLGGFWMVDHRLSQIHDALTESCHDLKRVADEIDGED